MIKTLVFGTWFPVSSDKGMIDFSLFQSCHSPFLVIFTTSYKMDWIEKSPVLTNTLKPVKMKLRILMPSSCNSADRLPIKVSHVKCSFVRVAVLKEWWGVLHFACRYWHFMLFKVSAKRQKHAKCIAILTKWDFHNKN